MRPFAVLFHPRCGSSLLMHLLRDNPGVFVRFEIFANLDSASHQEDVARGFLADATAAGAQVAIFKVAPYHILDKIAFMDFLRSQSFGLVVVSRDNLLRAVISQIRGRRLAEATRASHGKAQANLRSDAKVHIEAVTISRQELWHASRTIERERNDLKFFGEALSDLPQLRFAYEDLSESRERVRETMEDFLGLPLGRFSQTELAKLTSDDLAHSVSNLDQVVEWWHELHPRAPDPLSSTSS